MDECPVCSARPQTPHFTPSGRGLMFGDADIDFMEIEYVDGEAQLHFRVVVDDLLAFDECISFVDFMRRTGITRPRTRIVPG